MLVRARDAGEAQARLWRAMQLHLDFPQFHEYLQTRVRVFRGDLTDSGFGLGRDEYDRLVHTTDSVIHCAASLNRKSEKSCLNVNLRGTLEVLTLARHAEHYHGLRRFSQVSTVAVAGKRQNEVVTEDRSIDWERSDYDPYARTKKFCEHMMRVMLPETPKTIFRPSIVLGDRPLSRRPPNYPTHGEGFCISGGLAGAAISPVDRQDRYRECGFCCVCDFDAAPEGQSAIRHLPSFIGYRLSDFSPMITARALAAAQNKRAPVFVPVVERPFAGSVNFLANRKGQIGKGASLMKVFMPHSSREYGF